MGGVGFFPKEHQSTYLVENFQTQAYTRGFRRKFTKLNFSLTSPDTENFRLRVTSLIRVGLRVTTSVRVAACIIVVDRCQQGVECDGASKLVHLTIMPTVCLFGAEGCERLCIRLVRAVACVHTHALIRCRAIG